MLGAIPCQKAVTLHTFTRLCPHLYRNNLKNRFLPSPHPKDDASLGTPGSAWQQIFGFHSRPLRASSLRSPASLENSPQDCFLVSAAIRQWSLAPSQKFAPPPCHIPDSSDHFGIYPFHLNGTQKD